MAFRTKLLIAFMIAVLPPVLLLAVLVRSEVTGRIKAQYQRRIDSMADVIEEDLAREAESISSSLGALRQAILDDNRFRRAAIDRSRDDRQYLLDYAAAAMSLAGLSMLQIQDGEGRIISSGHFRNEYDRMERDLGSLLSATPDGMAILRTRAPDSPFLALVLAETFRMGGSRFVITGGVRVERGFLDRLTRDERISVDLAIPGETHPDGEKASFAGADGTMTRIVEIPFIDPGAAREDAQSQGSAKLILTHDLGELRRLQGSLDKWFIVAVAAALLLALAVAGWLSSRISRPLVDLAQKTSRLDLDSLDVDFRSQRRDEIGSLSNLLGEMTGRLRSSAVKIRDAEHRATIGELARQVNHDIKNGLTPIRNIFRHMSELVGSDPDQVAEVFEERQGTIDSSITYLETLASNYARLYPRSEREICNVNEIVSRVVTDMDDGRIDMQTVLCERATVEGDPVSIRRILENLIGNATGSIEEMPGVVYVSTEMVNGEDGGASVKIEVLDNGKGMSDEEKEKIFEDFYTTREEGTGLGLSIVKRLVTDLGGSITVDSRKGKGSRFIVELPAED